MKTKVIVLGSGATTKRFILENYDNPYIKIIGLIQDSSVDPEYNNNEYSDVSRQISPDELPLMSFEEKDLLLADIVFSPEYRRIIPSELCSRFLFVNCHGGVLPKWRGFAANAWAIMNGENEIGFTIHRVSQELDGGTLFYVKRIPISEDQTYGDVHGEMIDAIVTEVPKILYDVVNNINKGEQQNNLQIAYGTKFNASMGDISGFEKESSYYVNLFRCMAKPLGTGIFFIHNNKKYSVGRVQHGKKYGVIDYLMTNGKIINIDNNALWVKTSDNAVILSEIACEGKNVELQKVFKNGQLL